MKKQRDTIFSGKKKAGKLHLLNNAVDQYKKCDELQYRLKKALTVLGLENEFEQWNQRALHHSYITSKSYLECLQDTVESFERELLTSHTVYLKKNGTH